MSDSPTGSELGEQPIDWLSLSEDALFEVVLSPEISGLVVDFTRDEIARVVQAARAQGAAPGDFIRQAVLESTARIVSEASDQNQRLQVAD